MVNAKQIREIVLNYLSSGNAENFMLDFSAVSYGIQKNGDPEAVALVNKIESKIADLHGGCISLDPFKKALFDLLAESNPSQQIVVVYSGAEVAHPPAENASNSQQVMRLRRVPPKPMLPVVVHLVGQH
jgi:hypothetical protein